jgi:hypothetical protein
MRYAASLLVILSIACAEDRFDHLESAITLCVAGSDQCGPELSLGAFRGEVRHSTRVDILDEGDGDLTIRKVELVEGDNVFLGDFPSEVRADARGALELELVPLMGPNSAIVAVESDDPEQPRFEATLHFDGVAPSLVLCPVSPLPADASCVEHLTLDLGDVRPTQAADARVEVRNAGTQDLALSGAEISDTSSVAGEFVILTSTSAGAVAAGDGSPLVIRYQPLDGIPDTVTITITPTDTTLAPVTLTLSAAAPANLAPVAVAHELTTGATDISGEASVALWLDGRDSSDSEGDPLRYAWSIVARPSGSTAALETPDAALSRFVPDVLGSYIVQLTVTDSLALVAFADVAIEAAAHEFIWVDLAWGDDAGDVDLHLVPEGASLFSSLDCSFVQPSVDLGTTGYARDDAVLASDSEAGTGSERIVMRRPADGRYEVWAHYFDSRGGRTANVTATVRRDDGSVAVGSATTTLSATCQAWKAGVLEVPARAFTPSSAATVSVCYP